MSEYRVGRIVLLQILKMVLLSCISRLMFLKLISLWQYCSPKLQANKKHCIQLKKKLCYNRHQRIIVQNNPLQM